MKTVLIAIFTLIAFSSFGQESKNQKAVIKTNIYCSHCKACETCGKNFQANLYKIKGLKMFELDDKEMTITVFYNAKKTNLEEIRTAISNLGYDADEVPADVRAANNLDPCCKKS